MRQIILPIFIIISTLPILSRNSIIEAINYQIDRYPKSTLRDVYKNFFQDRFGPEHLVQDTASVRNYLKYELENMEETSLPYFEPVGFGERYYRVSLSVVKDSLIDENIILDAFIESANSSDSPSINSWKEEWHEILKYIPKDIDNRKIDCVEIEELLAQGKYAMHHSKQFNENYHPHYRIISKEIFEKRILPLLKDKINCNVSK